MKYYSPLRTNGKVTLKPPPPWSIALIANLKEGIEWGPGTPPDAGAEFDRQETIDAITAALEADGHWVQLCIADHTLPDALLDLRPHICFNIAEGIGGDAREAQAPALCELLGIPYTASRVFTNALSLEKTQTKRIWQSWSLPTPHFQEFRSGREPLDPSLRFPLFVKPAREGTGMGVGRRSLVETEQELREQVEWTLSVYRQPALVETFLPGREFTVGFIGNPGVVGGRRRPFFYDSNGYHFFPVLELDTNGSVTPGVYGHAAKSLDLETEGAPAYLCPADISNDLHYQLLELTRQAAEAIGACDVARVDFRLDAEGNPYLLEINTLPGLNPAISDLCIMATAAGVPYQTLITEILYLAAERFELPFAQEPDPLAVGTAAVAI